MAVPLAVPEAEVLANPGGQHQTAWDRRLVLCFVFITLWLLTGLGYLLCSQAISNDWTDISITSDVPCHVENIARMARGCPNITCGENIWRAFNRNAPGSTKTLSCYNRFDDFVSTLFDDPTTSEEERCIHIETLLHRIYSKLPPLFNEERQKLTKIARRDYFSECKDQYTSQSGGQSLICCNDVRLDSIFACIEPIFSKRLKKKITSLHFQCRQIDLDDEM